MFVHIPPPLLLWTTHLLQSAQAFPWCRLGHIGQSRRHSGCGESSVSSGLRIIIPSMSVPVRIGSGVGSCVLSVNDTFFVAVVVPSNIISFRSTQWEDFAFTCGFRRIRIVDPREDMDVPRIWEVTSGAQQQRVGYRLIRLCGGPVPGGRLCR